MSRLYRLLALLAIITLSATVATAQPLYWDGTSTTGNADGGNGTWDNGTTANWNTLPFGGSSVVWASANSAFFSGVPGSGINSSPVVTLATGGITTAGITFNIAKYTITGDTLTFGGTNNTVTLNNFATTASINSAIGTSSANMTFTAQNPLTTHTLTFGGISATSWSGTTTVNAGLRLEMTGNISNQALVGTSGITLNGGTIAIGSGTTGVDTARATLNRIKDTATITSYGGTIAYDVNNASANSETVGTLDLVRGQFNLTEAYALSSGSSTFIFSGLTRTGATNTSTVNLQAKNTAFSTGGFQRVVVGGIAVNTSPGEIVGPWLTTNYSNLANTDYVVYSNGGSGSTYFAIGANIISSAQTAWSTTATAASNYTLNNASGAAVDGRLTATRNINTARNTSVATALTSIASNVITVTGSTYVNGDVVTIGGTAPTGLANNLAYYVVNASGATFQLAATPGGPAITGLGAVSGNITGGVTLSSANNLGTNGILNGSTAAFVIGRGTTGGSVTLPTTASGNLYVTAGSANIVIDAPVTNNGVGVLTLVKSGASNLILTGTNTFTGGIVVNAGSVIVTPASANGFITGTTGADIINGGNLTYSSANAWGVSGRDVTFNGTGSLTSVAYTGGTLTVNSGANAQLANSATLAFATTTGTGTIISTPSANALLNLGNASGFTGNLQNRGISGATSTGIQFSSLGDGGALQFSGGNSDGGQAATFTYNGAGTLTFDARQVQILNRLTSNHEFRDNILANNSVSVGNNWVINTDLLVTGGEWITAFGGSAQSGKSLVLSGTNTDANAFTGLISNGTNPNGITLGKTGTGTWSVTNSANTYTGGTTVSGGILGFVSGALGTTGAINATGGTLLWNSGNTQDISSRLTMAAGTTTLNTNGNIVNFASAIGSSSAGLLVKTGSGTLTLNNTNTYTGTTAVNAGTLSLNYDTGTGGTATSKLADASALILGGGTLNLNGGTAYTEVVSATTLTAGTGSYVTRTSGTSVLQMGLITNNTGTVNFDAASIATANNTHTAGTILGTWATVGGDWAITAASGTNIPITAYASYTDVARLGTPGTGIRIIADGSTTNVRLIEGSGSSGTVTLAATTTQINTLNQSIFGPGTSSATIDAASKTLRTNGILMGPTAGDLTIGTTTGSGTLTSTATTGSIIVTNNSSNLLTINSVIANNTTTSLVKSGTGVLVLAGLNSYTGGTTLQDGTLRVGATTASILGSTSITGLTIANKPTAVFDLNNLDASIKDLIGGGSLGGNVTLGSGTLFIVNPSNGASPYNGTISGTGNLNVNGSSSWNTTSAHTYSGTTTVGPGNVLLITTILADGGVASGIGQSSSAAANLIFTGGSVSYSGTGAASTNRQFTLTGNGGFGVESTGAITWSSTAAVTYSGTGTRTLSFVRSGTGLGTFAPSIGDNGGSAVSISKTGTSNWTLTNTGSSFSGSIILNTTNTSAGTLSYASAGGTNPITFNQTATPGAATLSYIGSGQTMSGPITASALTTGTITLDASGTGAVNYSHTGSLGNSAGSGAKALVLTGSNTGNNILAGKWENNTAGGAATLTKNGVGTWVVSNNNTYTGATAVNAGTLLVNGNQSSALGTVTVASGATLGGASGIVGGVTTIQAGGTLSPGSSGVGTLTVNNNVTFNAGSIFFVDVSGSSADKLIVGATGTINLGGAVLSGSTTPTPLPTDVFLIIDNQSGLAVTGTFAGGTTVTLGNYSYTVAYDGNATGPASFGGNDVVLYNATFVGAVVPEPTSLLGFAAVGFGVAIRRRRKAARTVIA